MSNVKRRLSEGGLKQTAHRKARQIHEITRSGLVSDLRTALADGVDVNYNYSGQTAGHIAVELESSEKCQLLIQNGLDVNATNSDGDSLLNLACDKRCHSVARILIDSGADPNAENDSGLTPLMTSCLKRDWRLMEMLLRAGADPDIPDSSGRTVLLLCVLNDWTELVELLLEHGCDLDRKGDDLRSPLMFAVELENWRAIDLLLKAGANINHSNRENVNALFEAASRGQYDMVRYLHEKGANINVQSLNSITPLIESVIKRRLDVTNYLIQVGADVNSLAYNRQTPLHVAVKQAVSDPERDTLPVHVCRSLLNADCHVDVQNHEGHCPLYIAAYGGHVTLCLEILDKRPRLDLLTNAGNSLVHAGVTSGQLVIVECLIEAGAGVNVRNKARETPLYLAVKRKTDFEIVEVLVASGADLDEVETNSHQTALMAAVERRYHKAMELLCSSGCDVNVPDSRHRSPLNRACELKDQSAVSTLLASGRCRVDGSGNDRPLLTAIRTGSYKNVEMLIGAGCDVNVIDLDGHYAMHLAAENNVPSLVKLLLKHGADPDIARTIRSAHCCQQYTDPHPHLEISPLYIAVKNDALGILSVLLQCYSPLPYHDLGYLYDILFTTSYAQDARLSRNVEAVLKGIFNRVLFNAPSLLLLSRNACRKCLGSKPHSRVEQLPLPKTLIDFLLMKDVFKF